MARPSEALHRYQPAARCDQQILNQAIDPEIRDFEDVIQFFSAQRARADYLLTRNPDDFPKSGPPILRPDEFLVLYELAGDSSL